MRYIILNIFLFVSIILSGQSPDTTIEFVKIDLGRGRAVDNGQRITIDGQRLIIPNYYYTYDTTITYPPAPTGDSIWYELAHDQKVTTPETQGAGDRILEICPNRQWKELKQYSLTLFQGDENFYIQDTLLYASNTLSPGNYHLRYVLRDSSIWDTASIYVTVTAEATNHYFDFDKGTNGDGSYNNAYNTISNSYVFLNGHNYYFKRGTVLENFNSYLNITTDNVVIGAYDNGNRAELRTLFNDGSHGNVHVNGADNVTVRDIDVHNTAAGFVLAFVVGYTENVIFDNCEFRGQSSSTAVYQGIRYDGAGHYGGGVKNCIIHEINEDGVAVIGAAGTSDNNPMYYESNWVYNINWHAQNGSGDCFDIHGWDWNGGNSYNTDSRYSVFRYNLLSRANTIYKHAMLYLHSPDRDEDCHTIIEYNRCEGNSDPDSWGQNGISLYSARGVICRFNIINEFTRGIYAPQESYYQNDPDGWNMLIYGNLITNIDYQAIYLTNATDYSKVYNNTIVNYAKGTTSNNAAVYLSAGADNIEFKNNIATQNYGNATTSIYLTSGASIIEDYNIWSPDAGTWSEGANSIEGDPGFVTGLDSDYEIDGASPAYHSGTDVGLISDSWAALWPNPPSMGYKEYSGTTQSNTETYDKFMDSVVIVMKADFESTQTNDFMDRDDILNAYGYNLGGINEYWNFYAIDGFGEVKVGGVPVNDYRNWTVRAVDENGNRLMRARYDADQVELWNYPTDTSGSGHQYRLNIRGKWGTYDELYQTGLFRWHSTDLDYIYNYDQQDQTGKLPFGFLGNADGSGSNATLFIPPDCINPTNDMSGCPNGDTWTEPCDGFVADFSFRDVNNHNYVYPDTNIHSVNLYMYNIDQSSCYGDISEGIDPDNPSLKYVFDSKWHSYTIYVKLNTPGQANGVIRGFIDGKLSVERTNMRLRMTANTHIDWLKTYFFFGGSTYNLRAYRTHYMDIDEHYVYYYKDGVERRNNLLLPNWDLSQDKPIFNGVAVENQAGGL